MIQYRSRGAWQHPGKSRFLGKQIVHLSQFFLQRLNLGYRCFCQCISLNPLHLPIWSRFSRASKRPSIRHVLGAIALIGALDFYGSVLMASDHADPIDPFNREKLEGGITDLFVFPVSEDDKPAEPFVRMGKISLKDTLADIVRKPLTDTQIKKIDALVFILCVRRALTDNGSLKLEPFRYKIHIDTNSAVEFPSDDDLKAMQAANDYCANADTTNTDTTKQMTGPIGYGTSPITNDKYQQSTVEAFARYGGRIKNPEEINAEIVIEFGMNNEAKLLEGFPRYSESGSVGWKDATDLKKIRVATGVFDDPFIFPAFFGTNVVAMAVRVPIMYFPSERMNLLVWASSHKGSTQIDHVGRSLRTQNPRFDLLNTLHPRQHVRAIINEDHNPGLLRDIALRFNFAQTFAYRKWDRVPDVMCYSTALPVGYPNGRLLTDDVAALLAQHGDTLLYELSYQHPRGNWPRRTVNDVNCGKFNPTFPFLLPERKEDKADPPKPLALTSASIMKLTGIALGLLALLILENWIIARLYYRIKIRKRNL